MFVVLLTLGLCVVLGCTSYYQDWADTDAYAIINDFQSSTLGDRQETSRAEMENLQSGSLIDSTLSEEDLHELKQENGLIELSLAKSLEIATKQNRSYLTRQESRYLDALSYALTKHNFEPIVRAAVDTLYTTGSSSEAFLDSGVNMSIRDEIETGASVTLSGRLDRTNAFDSDAESASASVELSFIQPLLRGAGYTVSFENLTQARRNFIYEIRNFEQFRQELSINVASQFWNLLRQRQFVENARQNYESSVESLERARALYDVGRASLIDVFREELEELRNRNSLVDEQKAYELALDQFKILLGIPISEKVEPVEEELDFKPVTIDLSTAIKIALANRLDLMNEREQLEDRKRKLEIAKNNLLPDLDFTGSARVSTDGASAVDKLDFEDSSYSAGLSFEIPIERMSERNQYASARISYVQAQRNYDLAVDNVTLDMREALRNLRRIETTILIQEKSITIAERQLEKAEQDFADGYISNRDVVDARQALLNAKNNYVQALVQYKVAKLQFLRDLGILVINENGMWIE